jgi:pimeloyl-ACP methyl ester carboxylesterase
MTAGRSCRAVLFSALAAAVLATTASSTASAADCPKGAQCSTVTVPLDHSGVTPGTLSIAYAKVPATGARTGTLVFLAGGPGQSAIDLTTDLAKLLEPLRESYDIVTVDQRGTGQSGAVECKLDGEQDVAACADKLGPARAYMSTPETAKDLENLRVALGVDKLTLLGVSYGTKVAGEYARRYPAQTAGLVLDSPVAVDGLDGDDQLRLLGAPRVLREVCFPGPCSATVSDPEAALAAAAERLQDGAVSGPYVSKTGKVRTERVTEAALYNAIVSSDLNPLLRAGLPAAIASLADGDAAPLLHLDALLSDRGGSMDEEGINPARLLATSCIEARLPWAPDSPVASRADALKAFVAQRTDAFAPFSPETVIGSSVTALCQNWPPTPRPESVAYAGPDVPVLVVSGRDDLRTPLEDARRTAAQYPNATLLAVPGVGHSVLTSDFTGCALKGTVAFLSGQEPDACPRRGTAAALQNLSLPYTPATLGDLRATGGLSGTAGRTFSAVGVTLTGVGFDSALAGAGSFPGLRAGSVTSTKTSLTLKNVEWIRGVKVSGRLNAKGAGTLTVSGPAAAAGSITYAGRTARGTLGGQSFSLRS